MVKKSIAAALLVAMAAWAEMALAPMLAMPAHMLPGIVTPAIVTEEHAGMHSHAMPAGHACCPKIGATNNSEEQTPVEFGSSRFPFQDEHRCCFRQGPQSVPAPGSAQQRLSQGTAGAETAEIRLVPCSESRICSEIKSALGPPPSAMRMVLRV
jgi:hypothetical protein